MNNQLFSHGRTPIVPLTVLTIGTRRMVSSDQYFHEQQSIRIDLTSQSSIVSGVAVPRHTANLVESSLKAEAL